jgi:hypothetical protein
MQADLIFIDQLKRGEIETVLAGFDDYRRLTVAEMGGRALATMLGVAQALKQDGVLLEGRQYGDYAQSSGSGNANVVLASGETLATCCASG